MSFFNKYPYSDMHELNLDWIIAKMKELNIAFDEFKVINQITFSGAWDITKQYPAWTIVSDNNIGYVSIQPVPAGVLLTDGNYWQEVIDYTAQIAGLQSRVVALENRADTDEGNIAALRADTNLLLADPVNVKTFGAVGDGITDDTQAIQDAINARVPLFFPAGKYKTSDTITINTSDAHEYYTYIYGPSAYIDYDGNDAAIEIIGSYSANITLYEVTALNGKGIDLIADSSANSLQHLYFNIRRFKTLNECVYIEVNDAGSWCNEIVFNETNFRAGAIGINANVSAGESDRIILNNCSFEAVTKGLVLAQSGTGAIKAWYLNNPRIEECPDFMTTTGEINDILLVGTTKQPAGYISSFFTLSNQTNMKMVFANYEINVINGLIFRNLAIKSYNGAIPIPNNANINDYKIPGKYTVTSYGAAATLINWPNTGEFGNLYVEVASGTVADYSQAYQYLRQTVITGSSNHEYRREVKCEGGIWSVGTWRTIY